LIPSDYRVNSNLTLNHIVSRNVLMGIYTDITQYGQQLWSAPFQITLCMISLYQLLGPSMFAGIAAMLVMIPINGIIARVMKTLQKAQMKNKDSRTRLMTEILNNMKSIKLYGWGSPFMAKLDHVRNDLELHTLRKIGVAQAFASFTWSSTPFLVSCMRYSTVFMTIFWTLTITRFRFYICCLCLDSR